MASIVVCGGSLIGLSAAMMLARDGHHVTVLERDPAPPPRAPADAWDHWQRRGVGQFRQPHNLFPRFRLILDDELPGMVDRLLESGCPWIDPLEMLPPSMKDRDPRPGDDRFQFVTGRRPVVEAAFAAAAELHDGVTVRRGVDVAELVSTTSAIAEVPHVEGVRTADGDVLLADLVVDAMGRRSRLSGLLTQIGASPPNVESEECGFVYHTRYFTGSQLPPTIGPPLCPMGTFSLLTLPGDNDTWSVTLWAASDDKALRAFRDPDVFASVLHACPLHAHWLEGESITDVLVMAGILDRYRRFVVDDLPVATGVAAVGDAWACTNPSAGRGLTVGLIHAQLLRDVVRDHLPAPEVFVRAWDAATETHVAPFYWNQIRADRFRITEMNALRDGTDPPAPDPTFAAVLAAMAHDPVVFRGVLEMAMCLALPQDVLARPGFIARAHAAASGGAFTVPGPNREELIQLVG